MKAKKLMFIILGLAAVVVLVLVLKFYQQHNPEESSLFPKCMFFQLTGWKCPGCGSQRALHQLLRLNLSGAFHYNAMLVICIPIVLFYGSAELFGERFPRLQALSRSGILSWSVFTLFIAWWILRNIFNW